MVGALLRPIYDAVGKPIVERLARSNAELLCRAGDWQTRRIDGERWLGFTATFVSCLPCSLTLSRFHARVGLRDQMDDYSIIRQVHQLYDRPDGDFDEVVSTVRSREKCDQSLWMRLSEEEEHEIEAQRPNVGIYLTSYDLCDRRYWKRLLLTLSSFDRAFPLPMAAGEWCPEICWDGDDLA